MHRLSFPVRERQGCHIKDTERVSTFANMWSSRLGATLSLYHNSFKPSTSGQKVDPTCFLVLFTGIPNCHSNMRKRRSCKAHSNWYSFYSSIPSAVVTDIYVLPVENGNSPHLTTQLVSVSIHGCCQVVFKVDRAMNRSPAVTTGWHCSTN